MRCRKWFTYLHNSHGFWECAKASRSISRSEGFWVSCDFNQTWSHSSTLPSLTPTEYITWEKSVGNLLIKQYALSITIIFLWTRNGIERHFKNVSCYEILLNIWTNYLLKRSKKHKSGAPFFKAKTLFILTLFFIIQYHH